MKGIMRSDVLSVSRCGLLYASQPVLPPIATLRLRPAHRASIKRQYEGVGTYVDTKGLSQISFGRHPTNSPIVPRVGGGDSLSAGANFYRFSIPSSSPRT